MNRQDIHRRVIRHYGMPAQLEKVSEELRELDKEIWRWLDKEDNKFELLGELADVCNMIEQLAIIFDFKHIEIETEQNRKMLRTIKRLK